MPTYNEPALVRMPGLITIRPGAVLLDWLTLNLRAPDGGPFGHPWTQAGPGTWEDTVDPDSDQWRVYVTEPTDIRTSLFQRVTYVNRPDGVKVMTIWGVPHNGAMHDPRWIQVQFSNETLHTGEWVTLFAMLRAYGCELQSIGRVDISADGIEGSGGEWPAVVQGAISGEWRYYGHGSWRPEMFRNRCTGFNFGTRGSNKYVRAYRKAREMKQKGVKPWIVEAWANAWGFDVYGQGHEVNRMEVQTKGKELRRYWPGADADAFVCGLADESKRVDIYATMAPGIFDFRTHAKRARDAVSVVAWDWTGVSRNVQVETRAQRTHGMTDHTIKTYLRAMWTVATGTSDPAGFRSCEALARSCGSGWEDWYQRKQKEWASEWCKIEGAREAALSPRATPHAVRTLERTARIVDALRTDTAEMEQHRANLETLARINAADDAKRRAHLDMLRNV